MTDDFALITDDMVSDIQADVSNDVAETLTKGFNASNVEKVKNQLGLGIAKILKNAYRAAEAEMEWGLEQSGGARRGFAMGGDFILRVSDFYSQYVPVLAGNLTIRSYSHILDIIKRGESLGMGESDLKKAVGDTFSSERGRGSIIIRTEGTRASSLARRAVGVNGFRNGRGPHFFIYKALRDGRTTKTCSETHNFYWPANADNLSYWPPKHYYCRAGVVYGWEDSFEKKGLRLLTPQARSRLAGIQKKEFPYWRQQKEIELLNPFTNVRDSIKNSRVNDIVIENARRQMTDRLDNVIPGKGMDENTIAMIKEIENRSRRLDPGLRAALERDLGAEIGMNPRLLKELEAKRRK